MKLNKIGKVLTSKSVGTGPSSYEKRIYRAPVSQRLRDTVIERACRRWLLPPCCRPYKVRPCANRQETVTDGRLHSETTLHIQKAVLLKIPVLRNVTPWRLVRQVPTFRKIVLPSTSGSRSTRRQNLTGWPLKMEPIGRPETSAGNYNPMLC